MRKKNQKRKQGIKRGTGRLSEDGAQFAATPLGGRRKTRGFALNSSELEGDHNKEVSDIGSITYVHKRGDRKGDGEILQKGCVK